MTARVLQWALDQLDGRNKVILATVLNTSGSVPGKTGARLAMAFPDYKWEGTVGGAGLEHKILNRCRTLLKESTSPAAEVITYGLNKGAKGYEVQPLDSLCGGRVTLSLEVMFPMPHIFIMGGGHCGQALATLLDQLGWQYSVHDTRSEFASVDIYPNAVLRTSVGIDGLFENESFSTMARFSDVLLLGHDWSEDQNRLLGMLRMFNEDGVVLDGKMAPRIGVIGSRSKWEAFRKECESQGYPASLLNQVICPIGLNIGAESPEEIAVAIVAQIMSAFKNKDPSEPTWRQ
ncbi:MAG TPA: XdhC/CoxI family protein, partial [Poseidonia sp.]|nr:XdhC/CoxI family protein [Poseidonia sp.]